MPSSPRKPVATNDNTTTLSNRSTKTVPNASAPDSDSSDPALEAADTPKAKAQSSSGKSVKSSKPATAKATKPAAESADKGADKGSSEKSAASKAGPTSKASKSTASKSSSTKSSPDPTPPPKPTVNPVGAAKPLPILKMPALAKEGAAKPGLKGKDAVRARILAQRAKPAKPTAFSLEEVLAIAKTAEKSLPVPTAPVALIATKSGKTAPLPAHALQPPKPTTVRAASLADILGFNPKAKASHAENEEDAIPEKYKRYYKLLIELRNHVTGQVDQHSEETLKRSAKEDSGDLSSYGTDGGTDSFDRDFALSQVANEQEALAEVEAAIQRIKNGTYGVCEQTQQPINKDRLVAVPFTRYTAAAMKEIEKTRYKVRGQTGILGEGEEGGPKVEDDSGE